MASASAPPVRLCITGPVTDVVELVATLREQGLTLAAAESLTAGLFCARIADVPGASAVLRGGVVVYATDLKATLAGVPAEDLARHGAVHPETARALAQGARQRCGADLGVGLTGVAGPDPQEGHSVGTVFIAVAGPGDDDVCVRTLDGARDGVDDEEPADVRATVRHTAVNAAVDLVSAMCGAR